MLVGVREAMVIGGVVSCIALHITSTAHGRWSVGEHGELEISVVDFGDRECRCSISLAMQNA